MQADSQKDYEIEELLSKLYDCARDNSRWVFTSKHDKKEKNDHFSNRYNLNDTNILQSIINEFGTENYVESVNSNELKTKIFTFHKRMYLTEYFHLEGSFVTVQLEFALCHLNGHGTIAIIYALHDF